MGKPACKNCGNLFRTWKDLRVHMYKTHENEKDKEGNEKEIRSMIRNCTGDDMEETTRNIDDEEVNRDIVVKAESLISICEGSSKDYQIKDIRKVEFKHTYSGCDVFSNNNHKLNPHLITVNNEAIEQCETASIKDEQIIKCRICDIVTENKFHLQRHINSVYESNSNILTETIGDKHNMIDCGAAVGGKQIKENALFN